MKKRILRVADFTKYPGPRFESLGPNSGELFRDNFLIPAAMDNNVVEVDLDGVFGYGSSFLEEVFGGLIRKGLRIDIVDSIVENLISKDDPELILEIKEYVDDEKLKLGLKP